MGINIQTKKMNFFERFKIAILKLEDYGMFLGERISTALKYILILILLVCVIMSVASTYDFFRMINKMNNYIEKELPEFIYEDGKLNFDEKVEAYDNDYNFSLIINTEGNIDENNLKEYRKKINKFGIIILQNKAVFISEQMELEKDYKSLVKDYQFNINNKTDLTNMLNKTTVNGIVGTYFLVDCISTYIANLISIIMDIVIIAIFGWIAARFCGLNFRITAMVSLSIYSLSLSIVLNCIYNVSYIFTNFYIEHFNVIYLLIAYVYIIAAIFMIKYDLIKQNEEILKIIEDQKHLKEDDDYLSNNEKKEEKTNDNKEDDNTEDGPIIENNKEPDGSEI